MKQKSKKKGHRQGGRKGPPAIQTPEEVILIRRRSIANQEDVSSFFTRLVFLVVLLWLLFGMVFGLAVMRNDDMSPRISAGDLMLFYRLEDTLRADDVIIFEKEGRQYTGRVVAVGGDTVEVTEDARLMINGSYVAESDIYYSTPRYESKVIYPLTLEEGQVFVLCDYREGARDSRYFGPVGKKEIKGKVITVIRRSEL
ncbi:MAG TPA: signal peptidase I [Candidatus Eisenbergiella merdipullorum]|uniref:Signal peptidase I n=1 Tax=Candidatus Eisenbergiella merdipullorum TaxID=2838553 RepID=A0A9D2I3T3_9FIRM|nr:signal peptidase I [Candidatus Eisenbergiella merdipullorum]